MKTVRRSVKVRRSPRPAGNSRAGVAGGFLSLLGKLAGASDRLQHALQWSSMSR